MDTIISNKEDTKMKIILFSENSDNYQQIIDPLLVTENLVEQPTEKNELNKTKLVLFSENSNNYLQIKEDAKITNNTSNINYVTNSYVSKGLVLDFKLDNSLISYDYSKNIIFNETTIKNTLNVKRLNTTSDIRLKENIRLLDKGLTVIDKINPYSFNFKKSKKKVYGVIAQEIEEILPEFVSEVEGIKRVDYTQFTPILIKSVQELKSENTILKERLSIMEEKLNRLSSLLL